MLVTLFYVGYLVSEYPSNYLMQKFPIGKYLTINFILWGKSQGIHHYIMYTDLFVGIVLACSSAATNFAGLAACRFFLGVFEAPLNPGLIVITSSWWKNEEQARRVGLWYSSAGFVNVIVVLIFYGIAHIHVSDLPLPR